MRVLLTGANGFLGRYVQAVLATNGIETIAVGRNAPDSNFAADLLKPEDIERVVEQAEATHLMHLAWYVEHGKYWNSPLNLRWVEATVRLVEAFCKRGGEKVVVAGTCFEYAPSDVPCREDVTPLLPKTFYGTAKDAAQRLVTAACAHENVPCAWGRVFFPYGAGEDPQRLVPSLIAALTGKRPAFGVNRTARRDFIHAADVAAALVTLFKAQAQGAYNICTGQAVPIADVVTDLAKLLDADPAPILAQASARPGEAAIIAGDNQKLRGLGWKPMLSLSAGLERTLTDMGVSPPVSRKAALS